MARYLLFLSPIHDSYSMRIVITIGVLFLWAFQLSAQGGDIPETKPLKIKGKLDVKKSNKGTALNMPSVLDKKKPISINTK